MSLNPLEQFVVKPILEMEIFGFDISFTNASLAMVITTALIISMFAFVPKETRLIPSKIHILCEEFYKFISNMLHENAGPHSRQFLPLIFSIFMFILFANLLGMIPSSFAVTSSLIVTSVTAASLFLIVIITGFVKQGFGFLKIFAPPNLPIWLLPLIVIIEFIVFFARPITLSLRLVANMIAGHIMLKVLAGFVVLLPFVAKPLPMPLLVVLVGFEIFVAILQAYIFSLLTCVYLNDALNGH